MAEGPRQFFAERLTFGEFVPARHGGMVFEALPRRQSSVQAKALAENILPAAGRKILYKFHARGVFISDGKYAG